MKVLRTSAKKRVLLIRAKVVLSGLLIIAAPLAASAATVCVNPAGTGGCFKTIALAVGASSANDTIEVGKGTYAEDVTILKSLSIVGANPKNTIIDATGKANGFFVDGIDVPGLSNVVISGFTVKNANFEGILVANASSVTVSNNIVTGNDKSLVPAVGMAPASCTGIPAFETGESDDCGEGIHLLGADHSIVADNLVQNNAGGILTSDDTGAASHNLITGNTVQKNSLDCGITLASHSPAALTQSQTPLGVTQNTVSNNLSTQNGLGGEGAGVGIFVGAASGTNSGNVVVGNTITKNTLPGVTMHAHAPGENITNNVIIDNTISGNAADTGDAATSGPTGINVFGVSAATGTIISGNTINNESLDVVVNTPASVDVHLNNLLGKNTFGVKTANGGLADATQNFWGCPKGPPAKGCSQVIPSTGITVFPVSSKRF